MASRSFVWLSTAGGAWSLSSNWADTTDGGVSAVVPGAQDSVVVGGLSGAGVQTITGPGQAAAAVFTGNTLLSGVFSIADLMLGQAASGGLLELGRGASLQSGTVGVASGSLLVGAGAGLSVTGTLSLGSGSGSGASGNLNVTGGGTASVASLFLGAAADAIYVDPASVLEVGGTGQGQAGRLTVDAGGLLSGQGNADAYGSVANAGTIAAQGGTLALGALSGTGTLLIGAGATLRLQGLCGAGQSVDFAGANATLALQAEADAPAGTIAGLAAGDAIDVLGSLISSATYQAQGTQGGVLTLFYGNQAAATLHLSGSYAGDVFLTAGDGADGTLVTLAAASQGGGAPSPGTTAPDAYAWVGGQAGGWGTAANWADLTLGSSPAAIAPGANNLVTIAAAQTAFTVISGPANAAALTVSGEVALSGASSVGTLAVGVNAASGTAPGVLDLLAGTTLQAAAASVVDGTLSASGSLCTLDVAGTLSLGGGLSGVGLPVAALLVTSGASVQAGGLTLGGGSGDSIVTDPTATLEVGTAGHAALGAVSVDAGATLAGNGSVNPFGAVVDNGTILASGGTLTLGAVSGTGTLSVAAGATLELMSATAVPISLLGSAAAGAVLAFADPRAAPSGTISGLVAGDVIHLEGSPLTALQFVAGTGGGTLLLAYGTTVDARLAVAGSFAGERFVLTPDGTGGSLIALAATTGGGGSGGQTGTDQLAWTNPVSGGWGHAAYWSDLTTGAAATAPPGAQTPVTLAGPGGIAFADVTGPGTCSSLSASGNIILTGAFATGALGVAAGGALVLGTAATLTAAQAGVAGGELLAVGTGAQLTVAGTLAVSGAGALLGVQAHAGVLCRSLTLAGGAVNADVTSSVEVGTLGGAASGALTIDAGAQASGNGSLNLAGPVIDNGVVSAQAGTLWLGAVSGSGSLAIGTAATLALAGADSCPVAFTGSGATLLLGGPAAPAGGISGFAAGDTIVVADTPIDSVAYQSSTSGTGTLTLGEAGHVVERLVLLGSYLGDVFAVQPDGTGAEVTVAAQGGTGQPTGTATPDAYVWIGGQGSAWSTAANWQDVTLGQSPAATAPGLNNMVSVAGDTGVALLLSGPADAASLSLTGTVALAGSFVTGTLALGMAGTPAVLALGSGSSVAAGTLAVLGAVALNGGTLNVATTAALGVAGGQASGGQGGVLDAVAGTVDLGALVLGGAGSAVVAGPSGTVEVGGAQGAASGCIQVDSGGLIQGAGSLTAASISDNGTIAAAGGTLVLGAVAGDGLLLVGVGAELALTGTAGAALTADFAGGGTLSLGSAALAQAPAIADFGAGDTIILSTALLGAAAATSATYAETAPGSGVLTVDAGTQTLAQLTLLGDQAGLAFTATGTSDGDITLTATPDNTSGQGDGFMTTSTSSYGTIVAANNLVASLVGVFSTDTLVDLQNVVDQNTTANQSTWEWVSAQGSLPSAASQVTPTSVEIVGPNAAPQTIQVLQTGYKALLLEGQENLSMTDGSVGGALLVGNAGADAIAVFGDGDTIDGGAGSSGTVFFARLAAGAAGTTTGHDVFVHGSGNDTIITNNDAAAVTTSGGHSEVFLGAPQNFGSSNDVVLDGADTVVCGQAAAVTDDNITVNAAVGLAGDVVFGPAAGVLNFVGGNTAATVVGGSGQIVMHGGAANNNLLWAGNSAVDYVGGSGSAVIVGGPNQTYVQGGAGPVTVFGGTGLGVYSGGAGSVFVVGHGASTVTAGTGVTVYVNGGANVSVAASTGADVYAGASTGNNIFQAGAGSETLWGGLGNDLFLAGSGQTGMVSGGGDDVFSFTDGLNNNATDSIYGFVPGQDMLQLNGYGSVAPQITHSGGSSFLHLQDGTQITVVGVANLTASSLTLK